MLSRAAPMKRGGFSRKLPAALVPRARATTPAKRRPVGAPRAVMAAVVRTPLPVPKQPRERNAYLLATAKGKACLFWFVPECRRDFDHAENCTTVKCHSNKLAANKGKGYKAHDWLSVDGCVHCHDAYDKGSKHSQAQKDAAFDAAFERQIQRYRDLLANPLARPKDRDAARWAINRFEFHQLKEDRA